MAKVTLYQQGQLASQQVGTPGVYTGTSNMLGAISQGAEGVGNALYSVGNAIFQTSLEERRAKEAELRAYERQLKNAQIDTDVADKMSAVDREFTDHMLEIKGKSNWDTTNALSDFSNFAETKKQQYLDNIEDPLVKVKVQSAFSSKTAQYTDNLNRWVEGRQVPIMESQANNIAGNFALSVSNAELGAGEVGQKIAEYKTSHAARYNFLYGENASVKMRQDTELGVTDYLSATALNAPDLLEDRIKAFSGGTMIEPTKLNKFAGEQRRIAAEVKAAQIAAQKQTESAAQLDTMKTILDTTTTGNWKDADPKVIHDTLKKNAPLLTNEQNIKFEQLAKQATEKQKQDAAKLQVRSTEENIVRNFGVYAANEEKLAAEVETRYSNLFKSKGKDRIEQSRNLALAVDRYQDAYMTLNAAKGSITNKDLKQLSDLHLESANTRFGSIMAKLKNDKNAQSAIEIKTKIFSQIYPPSMFPDARRQTLYNHFYRQLFDKKIQDMNMTETKTAQFMQDTKAVQALGRILHTQTLQYLRAGKVLE